MLTNELVAADATAVQATAVLVGRLTAADLTRPTPCAGWDLEMLLRHMTAQHLGFAAAAEGRGADLAAWALPPAGVGVLGAYPAAAEAVLTAFAAGDVLQRPFVLAEFDPARTIPGRLAVGFHLVDYLVHGWDVARAVGAPFQPAASVLAAALPIVRAVPDDRSRCEPGAAFAPALPVPAGTQPLSEILLLLGRNPRHPTVSGGRC
jgi:uncharacterized protein (TIGR03086 family)